MHPSEQSSLPGTAFRSQPLHWHLRWVRFQPTPHTLPRTSLQPRLVVERGSGMDKGQEFGTAGNAWVTASPRRFHVHSVVPRRRVCALQTAATSGCGGLVGLPVAFCHSDVPRGCAPALPGFEGINQQSPVASGRRPVCFLGKREAACECCLIAVGAVDVPLPTKPEPQLEAHPPVTPPQLSTAGPFHPRACSCHTAISELKRFLLPYLHRGCFLSPLQALQPTLLLYPLSQASPDPFRTAHLICEVLHSPLDVFFFSKCAPLFFVSC